MTKETISLSGWPTGRSGQNTIAAQFGTDRAELARWALMTGDPLMDAVVEEIHGACPQSASALQKGFREGLAALSDPSPALRALFEDVERRPAYVDDAFLRNEASPFFTTPPPIHMVSLSAGALIRVYESPSIAAVLGTTGRLIDGAERRIKETGKWLITAMMPGGLQQGAPGYVATLQVRLLHAQMRRAVLLRGYDQAAYGVPINQVDLARTWMDFTLTSFAAEEAMGFGLTSGEAAELYRYWWYIAHLLGLDRRLVEGIASHEQAARVDALLQAVTGPLIPESATLADATLDTIAAELRIALKLPGSIGSRALRALARRFHGDTVADELAIPREHVANAILAGAIMHLRQRRLAIRRDPRKWSKNREMNLAQTRALLSGQGAALFEEA